MKMETVLPIYCYVNDWGGGQQTVKTSESDSLRNAYTQSYRSLLALTVESG